MRKKQKNLDALRAELIESNRNLEKEIASELYAITSDQLNIKQIEEIIAKSLDKDEEIKKLTASTTKQREEVAQITKVLSNTGLVGRLPELKKLAKIGLFEAEKVKKAYEFTVARGTISVLSKIASKQGFISQGFKIVKDGGLTDCPFCEQPIIDKDGYISVIGEYETIFNEKFNEERESNIKDLNTYKDRLFGLLTEGQQDKESNISFIGQINEALEEQNKLPICAFNEEEITNVKNEITLLETKISKDLEVAEGSKIKAINDSIGRLNGEIEKYNSEVDRINEQTKKKQESLASGELIKERDSLITKVQNEEKELIVLRNVEKLKIIFKKLDAHSKNGQTIGLLEKILNKYKDKIKEEFKVFSDDYFEGIKKHLDEITSTLKPLEIVCSRSTYHSGSGEVLCGFKIQYNNKDRLTELSEGEKQAVALAYFFAYLDKVGDKENKLLCFDDPVSSFDNDKRYVVAQKIAKEAEQFGQTIVLTHDDYFEQEVWNLTNGIAHRSAYEILGSTFGTIIKFGDKGDSYRAAFKKLKNSNAIVPTSEITQEYGRHLRFCVDNTINVNLGLKSGNHRRILEKAQSISHQEFIPKIPELLKIYDFCNKSGILHPTMTSTNGTNWRELKPMIDKFITLVENPVTINSGSNPTP